MLQALIILGLSFVFVAVVGGREFIFKDAHIGPLQPWQRVAVGALGVVALAISVPSMIREISSPSNGHPTPRPEPQASTPVVTPDLSPPTPTSTPRPTASTRIDPVARISVPGRSARGIQFTAEKGGTYRFAYAGGAYSVYAPGTEPKGFRPWLTAVCVFDGDQAPFDGEVLRKGQALLRIADNAYAGSQQDAIDLATGSSWFETDLADDQTVTLIGVDHRYSYGDNPGTVEIQISLVARTTSA